ncbi:MAG: hypothetical protein HY231_11740 [Acidobacteria bacterium]|nr:hypothetical protein [Acidobacteriota bacterium]
MSLIEDWYIYHSKDDLHWALQEGGPYDDEQSKAHVREDEAREHEVGLRVARIAYPHGALPDKQIERAALDQTTPNRDL